MIYMCNGSGKKWKEVGEKISIRISGSLILSYMYFRGQRCVFSIVANSLSAFSHLSFQSHQLVNKGKKLKKRDI